MFESSIDQTKQKRLFLGIIFNELTEVCLFFSVLQAKKVDHNFALYMYLLSKKQANKVLE